MVASTSGPLPLLSRIVMETLCPACGAILYSRRAKLCGVCNCHLPEEVRITGEQAEKISGQYQQAMETIRKIRSEPPPRSGGDGGLGQ
jgi:hypothetical protein